ncbi:hypothetical protein BTM25_48490 [Actinomadura rubteroloni]|uniref:DUF742 domain-containing protein n=1 Tax=Actinomadura rubteroloni TaxID=1926885 RepID=A0A2P4UC69_9ACTN|nr:DUF742 domain-containing protein [Actinomadura rubteroloni]POM22645.1 hypothetical protein BTM25_48490 [Actinomadura rubteroloni]
MPEGPEELWVDEMAGPVVRPYAVAKGRARHAGGDALDLLATVQAREPLPDPAVLSPEEETILDLCRGPVPVAEIAAELALPLGVVRVLLGDLLERRLVTARSPETVSGRPDTNLLKEMIDGLRAL